MTLKTVQFVCVFLVALLFLPLLTPMSVAEERVQSGDSFTYSKAEHWGKDDHIWSWQWAEYDSNDFSDMTFTTVEGQGDVYAADWEKYPYCAARSGGINIHPNINADAARVFTAPASGWVTIHATVARTAEVVAKTKATPTSFRILLEDTTVYPTKGDYRVLSTTDTEDISVEAFVKKGEKLRFVVGAMGNQTSDAVNLQTTVTYDTVESDEADPLRVGKAYTYKKTSATFGTADPNWSWEWTLAGKTIFSPMTFQYVEKYGREMYASDWATHPYNYVDSLGVKLHPAETADTVKTFTVPYTGTVNLNTEVSRYTALADVSNSAANGTSLRILVNNTQVYPLYSSYVVLNSTTVKDFDLSLPVTKGDKIRIIIGGIGQVTSDAVKMYNTVTYTDLSTPKICVDDKETFSVNAAQFANHDMGNWSFEYRDSNDTFGNMTYQYVEKYSKYMYASDWTTHAYNYVDLLGVKMHPAKTRDAVKTYTVPHDGRIQMNVKVARYNEYVEEGSKNPTSLRVYKNDEQIWPTNGGQKEITSTTATTYYISADVRVGDKIRCVVGSMGNATDDAISMYNTVTYRAVGLRELAVFTDQYNQRIDVIDIHGDNLNSAERAWSWKPTAALGFTDLATFNSPGDAKIRYNKSQKKYVVAVCSARGFMGLVDFATGKKLWQVSLTGNPCPHAIEYLPNGNVAVAASLGNWIRVYTASQGSTSTKYAEAYLFGAHGVLWDPDRKVLWGLGDEEITAYTIGGSAAAPTLTEVTKYRASVAGVNGHDLSPVYGNKDRLWVSSDSIYQYDIPTKQFLLSYDYGNVISRAGVKGISNFPDSNTTIHVFPNNTLFLHDSDRVFVTLTDNGEVLGMTHRHDTGAYYKVRSWVSAYQTSHKVHLPTTVPGKAATCLETGLTEGSKCSLCGKSLTAQEIIPASGHKESVDRAVEASCTDSGLTEGKHCSVCDTVLIAQEVVPATGHSYVYTQVNSSAHLVTCKNCNLSVEASHIYADGVCICGEQESTESVEDASLKLSHSLNLASDITLNYAIAAENLFDFDMETVKVEVRIPVYEGNIVVEENTITLLPELRDNYYYFVLEGMTAVQMNDKLTAVLCGSKDGQEFYSPVDEYSIATYAYSQMRKTGAAETLKTLCADLLRYGAKAQIFKSYRLDALVDANMTEEHKSFLSDIDSVVFGNTNSVLNDLGNAPIHWEGKALDLASKVAVKFIFSKGTYTGDLADLTLKISCEDIYGNVKDMTIENPELYNADYGYYAFTLDALLAAELRSVLSAQIYNGETPVSCTLQYSADTYGNNKKGNLLELCKALFAYSDSARAYFQ